MTKFTFGLALMSLCWFCCSASNPSPQTLEGRWSGSFEVNGRLSALRLDIDDYQSRMRLIVQETRVGDTIPATRVVVDPPQLRFELGKGPSKRAFEGHIRADRILGVRTASDEQGPFHLRREARRNSAAYDEYVGPYKFDDGQFVFIARSDTLTEESPHVAERSRLYYVDESGSTRMLYHASDSSFYTGPSIVISAPTEVELSFTRNSAGLVSGLKWKNGGQPERFAVRSDAYRQEEVAFQSGDVRLAARLLVPSGDGPHPGVVVVSGGNGYPVNRNGWYQVVGDVFARNGIASLIYDKRGGGRSTGDSWAAGPEESARDALAAVDFLRHLPEVDSENVGLWGISEFGWFGPLAASRDEKLAFLVMVSVAARGRFASNMRWAEEHQLPSAGFTPEEIREAMEFSAVEHDFARGRIGWERLADAFERSRAKKWFYVTQMGSRGVTSGDDRFWAWYRLWAESDPAPALSKIRCPVLAVWCETEARGNRDVLENIFLQSSLRDYTIKVFPDGGHLLFLESEYGRMESVKTYVPGYFQTMTDWILERAD